MRKLTIFCKLLAIVILAGCANSTSDSGSSLFPLLEGLPRLKGKTAFLDAPYVTAGNRVYAVGHQDGTFPDLGWHVTGEMGGIVVVSRLKQPFWRSLSRVGSFPSAINLCVSE